MISNAHISPSRAGIRLDAAVLEAFPTSTRALVRAAIADGSVRVDSRRALKGLKLSGRENIFVKELLEEKDNLVLPDASFAPRLVYEDGSFLAFDKPPGMPVQPLSCRETGTLMNAVVSRYPECRTISEKDGAGAARNRLMAGALHRIDADTSGLVLVARTQEAFDSTRRLFAGREVVKTYLALVEGNFEGGGVLENDLIHDPSLPYCRMIDRRKARIAREELSKAKSLAAVTAYRCAAHMRIENEDLTLLEVTIRTGVTHQIRAQLSIAGMHIVNDRLYGAFAVEGMRGHRLHSLSAKFIHPVSGKETNVSTAIPDWAKEAGYEPAAATVSMPSA